MNRTLISNVKNALMIQSLTLVKIINRVLNGADGVEEISIVSAPVFGADSGRFCEDELLSLKFPDVLGNRVSAHVNSLTYALVAWIALEGFPIFAVHQVGVDSNFPEG